MRQGTGETDRDELAAIYDEYFPRVYNYVFYRLLHREDTEDVVSAVFCKVCAHIGSYDSSRAGLYTWIMNICKNTLIDFYRTKKTAVSTDALEESGEGLSVDFEAQYSAIAAPERRELLRALGQLPERERMIIYYKYYEGRKNNEIAQLLGLNASTVSTLAARCREKLKALLGDGEAVAQ